jgi:AcrR family transcriptional regulator
MPKNLPNVKEEIMECTREMIKKSGAAQINIRDIAKNCGIATGTFYNYFGSKQEIIISLMAADWEKMRARILRRLAEPGSALERLEFVFTELSRMMRDVHTVWAEGFDEVAHGTMPSIREMKQQLREEFTGYIKSCIEGRTPKGEADFMADHITRMFFSYAYESEDAFAKLKTVITRLLN